jgi:hypothetical protein
MSIFMCEFLRDKEGHEIDVVIEHGTSLHAIEIKSGQTVPSDALKGIHYWKSRLEPPKTVHSWLVYGGDRLQKRSSATYVPWTKIHTLIKHVVPVT